MNIGKKIARAMVVIVIMMSLFVTALFSGNSEGKDVVKGDPNVTHIVMTYQTIGSSRTDELDQIVEAVNQISREKIGVEIELLVVDASESTDKYPLWITQGKQMDLMLINYQDITNYVDHDMLLSLNKLLKTDGEDINEISETYRSLYSGTTIDGETYGVSVPSETKGNCAALWIAKRYLDEMDFDYDENHIYSFDDLDGLFAKLKEKYPNVYPLGQIPSQYNFSTSTFYLNQTFDGLGASYISGVLDPNSDNTKLVNFYESPTYYDWLVYMREWYQKGYIYPDAAITTSSNIDLVKAGIVLSIPQNGTPDMFTENEFGEPVVAIRLSPITYGKQSTTGIFWTIPKTAKAPEAAMKFLNLMYTSDTISNLFKWGIEGVDYVKNEDGSVTWPTGLSQDTVGYFNPLGIYGDQRRVYALNSNDIKEKNEAFSSRAVEVNMQYEDFYYDSTPVGAEMNQIQKVMDRYLSPLESGSVDLDEVYPEFIEKLHNAGIDNVIEEKQRQFDTWREANPSTDSSDE